MSQIAVQDVIKHQTKIHMLSLSGFQGRENKTTRFTVRVRFSNRETAVITLKDNGFGEISPTEQPDMGTMYPSINERCSLCF